jgi:hypothetical protein
LTCAGVAAYITEAPSASSCQSCLLGTEGSCERARAWAGSTDGDAYWRCVMSSTTPDQRFACQQKKGKPLFDPFQRDYSSTCADRCKYGNYWACVGQVSWPAPPNDGGTFGVDFSFNLFAPSVSNPTTGTPWADAMVSICGACPCLPGGGGLNTAAFTGASDQAGVVSGHELVPPDGFEKGCMEVTSPPDASTPLVPTFCYWGYPLTVSKAGASGNEGCPVLSVNELASLANAGGFTLDPNHSFMVAATVFDCLGAPAPNVALSVQPADSNTLSFVFPGTLKRTSTLFTSTVFTGTYGIAAFLNVPIVPNVPGGTIPDVSGVTLTAAAPGPDGGERVFSTFSGAIQQSTVTQVMMFPTPMP